jgi:prepilin-type processing-associated H-X9-DG protein
MKYTGRSKGIFFGPQLGKFAGGTIAPTYVMNWQITSLQSTQLDTVPMPSKVVAIWELTFRPNISQYPQYFIDWDKTNEYQRDADVITDTANWWWFRTPGPHNGALSVLFLDAHVKSITRRDPNFKLDLK